MFLNWLQRATGVKPQYLVTGAEEKRNVFDDGGLYARAWYGELNG